MWIEFKFKKSLWVICKILGLFVNPLSVDNKYSVLKRGNVLQHFQMQLSQKPKIFSLFFFLRFLNLDSILNIFKMKKDDPPCSCIFIFGLQKTCLDKCVTSPVLEDNSTSNMLNWLRHCWNLNDSIFTIFIDPCEENSGWKSLSEWYAESYDFLLFHSLPIISVLFLTEEMYCNIFRCDYFRNQKYYLIYFCIF